MKSKEFRPRAGAVVINSCGEILFMYRSRHRIKKAVNAHEYLLLPGGTMEEGEIFAETATREIREETSLEVKLGPKIYNQELAGDRHHVYFLVTEWRGTPQLGGEELEKNCPENFYELRWIPLAELDSLTIPVYPREIIPILQNLSL